VETYRRVRNTFRFLHANINGDFDPETNRVPYEQLSPIDKWLLSRLHRLIERVTEAYKSYSFNMIYHSIQNFCAVDLSALYLDIIKDRMYVERKDAVRRRASQTVAFDTLMTLVRLAAPILSFTCEEMWSYLKPFVKEESVLLTTFPEAHREWIDPALEEQWENIWRIREAVNKKIEEKRVEKVIGHPLDAKVTVTLPENDYALVTGMGPEFKDVLIVSQVEVRQGAELDVVVTHADGEKCDRCWQYATTIEKSGPFPNCCERCRNTLT
jgi:isoleucyl-tRNA synthetase